MTGSVSEAPTFAHRLCEATNSHDVERVVDCFTEGYVNENPTHPSRSFVGRDQVRRNWKQIFASVPDLEALVVRSHQVDDLCWSEWEMRGTRVDGSRHLLRGVMVFTVTVTVTVTGDRARGVRFYLEPVEHRDGDADAALEQILARSPR